MCAQSRIKEVNVMLGCPDDAVNFRHAVEGGIEDFNQCYGDKYKVHINGKNWCEDTYSSFGSPAEKILEQMEDCEMLIAFFYLSVGTAYVTDDPGTIYEIKQFSKQEKQVFIFEYKGEISTNTDTIHKIKHELDDLKKYNSKLYHKPYENSESIRELTKNELRLYYESCKSKRSVRNQNRIQHKNQEFHDMILEHMKLKDQWLTLEKFSFEEQSRDLVLTLRENGSVSYYIKQFKRYRTTPVASTLQALDVAGLLPIKVRNLMQDWVFASKDDKCDAVNENEDNYKGHEPDECDRAGWSLNEGVSVWTTSKTLETLLSTRYYYREDIKKKREIKTITYNAFAWLIKQQYDDGGWGFQKHEISDCCKSCVTMTALVLKVLALFQEQKEKCEFFSDIEHNLEKKIEYAHAKGVQYLIKTREPEAAYWKYAGDVSVTGSVWVLDWLNHCDDSNSSLSSKKSKLAIISEILARLPENETQFQEYVEEVYFTGGETKYKNIEKNSKFYSYMPYHVKVLLEAGVPADDKRIVNIVKCLISIGNENWKGTERRNVAKKRSSFTHAMALSTIAIWLRQINKESYSKLIEELKGNRKFTNEEINKLVDTLKKQLQDVKGNNSESN